MKTPEEREAYRQKARNELRVLDIMRAHVTGTTQVGWSTDSYCSCGWTSHDPASEGSLRMHEDVRNQHVLDMLDVDGFVLKRKDNT